jgi:hypothetical protein
MAGSTHLRIKSVVGVALLGAVLAPAISEPADRTTAPTEVPMPLVPLTDLAPAQPEERIRWRKSKAVGLPYAGRLVRGVQLPAEGRTFFTWDPIRDAVPNRGWRRWGTDRLIRTTLRVARTYRRETRARRGSRSAT